MSATTLQQHGRSIVGGLPAATHRQGTECGTLISTAEDEEEEEEAKEPDGLTTTEQIGIALAVLVLLIGGGAAIGGL